MPSTRKPRPARPRSRLIPLVAAALAMSVTGCVVDSSDDTAAKTMDATIAALEAREVACGDLRRLAQARVVGDSEAQDGALEVLAEAPFDDLAEAAATLAAAGLDLPAAPSEGGGAAAPEAGDDEDGATDDDAATAPDGEAGPEATEPVTADDLAELPDDVEDRGRASAGAADALEVMSSWAFSRCGIDLDPASVENLLDIDIDDGVPPDELSENVTFVDVLAAVRRDAGVDTGWWGDDAITGIVSLDIESIVVNLTTGLTGDDAIGACEDIDAAMAGVRDDVVVWLESPDGTLQAYVMADGSCRASEASTPADQPDPED